jgi:hypothetical protein
MGVPVEPCITDGNLAAHHIVPGDIQYGNAAEARKLLDEYQLDINSSANVVGLVGGKGAPKDQLPRHHRGGELHNKERVKAVTERLKKAVESVDDWALAREYLKAEH